MTEAPSTSREAVFQEKNIISHHHLLHHHHKPSTCDQQDQQPEHNANNQPRRHFGQGPPAVKVLQCLQVLQCLHGQSWSP